MEYLEIVQRLVTTLAAGTGGVVAILGLRAWKEQLRGRSEYELARRLLRATLKVRDEIAYVRGPLIEAGEIAAAVEQDGSEVALDDPEASELARLKRWRHLASAVSDVEVEALEGEVLWGSPIQDLVDDLRERVRSLRGASWEYGFLKQAEAPLQEAETNRMIELRRCIFGTGGDDDEFAATVDAAVDGIETHLRKYLDV